MAKVVEDLFLRIGTQFDASGANQGLEILTKLNDTANALTRSILDNTVVAFSAFEDELVAVAKTTGLAGKELNDLANGLMDMSNSTGQGVEELAKIAAVAGQLGVKKSDIQGFTEQVNKMAIALDLTADQAAAAGAKIANSFAVEVNAETITRIGDTVNSLSDSTAAAAGQIIGFMQQFGGTARQMGITIEQAAGLGSTLIATGMDASDAATRLTTALDQMTILGKKGGGGLTVAADLLGMSVDAFKNLASEDRLGALDLVVRALEKIPNKADQGQKAFEIFGRVGKKAILPLVGNMDALNKNIDTANKKTNTMEAEFNNVMNTLSRQYKRTNKIITNLGIIIGKEMAPTFTSLLKTVNNILQGVYDWAKANPGLVEQIGKIALALTGVSAIISGITGLALFKAGVSSGIGMIGSALLGSGGAGAAASGGAAAATATATGGALAGISAFLTGTLIPAIKLATIAAGGFAIGWKIGELMGELTGLNDYLTRKFSKWFDSGANTSIGSRMKGFEGSMAQMLSDAKLSGDTDEVKRLLKLMGRDLEARNSTRTNSTKTPLVVKPGESGVQVMLTTDSEDGIIRAIVEELKAHVSGLTTCGSEA